MLSRGGRVPSGVSPRASSMLLNGQIMLTLIEIEDCLPSISLVEERSSRKGKTRQSSEDDRLHCQKLSSKDFKV
jgi:hypothetical protein